MCRTYQNKSVIGTTLNKTDYLSLQGVSRIARHSHRSTTQCVKSRAVLACSLETASTI